MDDVDACTLEFVERSSVATSFGEGKDSGSAIGVLVDCTGVGTKVEPPTAKPERSGEETAPVSAADGIFDVAPSLGCEEYIPACVGT